MAMRGFVRRHDFLVCIDADAVIAPAMACAACAESAQRVLRDVQRVADVVAATEAPAAELKSRWNAWHLPAFSAVARCQVELYPGLLQRLLGMGYDPVRVLVVGTGGHWAQAAKEAGVLYYPARGAAQAAGWQRLCEEAVPKFLHGFYAGAYQEALYAAEEDTAGAL